MDCLHEILPVELVQQIQKYTSHQICDDKYFTYKKNMRIHNQYISHYTPGQMVEMFASYFNQEFMDLARETDIRGGLVSRLGHNYNFNGQIAGEVIILLSIMYIIFIIN